ncbi:hypothetical protein [Streptomyces sp. NPDC003327]
MLVRHVLHDGVLHVRVLRELDVTSRAAAALEIEALVAAHRPRRVHVELASAEPSAASLSALARLRRMCEGFGIPVVLDVPGTASARGNRRPETRADARPEPVRAPAGPETVRTGF